MADAKRVALLARPGEACERLRAALREAGGEIVLEADPSTLAADALRAAAPQTVLVALDPTVEDALERFDAVLGDPGVAVIFDEADLAARREGWDAARWVRHLAAKLHRHDDVLPPVRQGDGGMDMDGVEIEEIAIAQAIEVDIPEFDASPDDDAIVFEEATTSEAVIETADDTSGDEDAPLAFTGLSLTDDIDEMSLDGDAPARRFEEATDFDALLAGLQATAEPAADSAEAGLEDFLASTPDVAMDMVADLPAAAPTPAEPPPAPPAADKPSFDFGALSLADQDEAPAPSAPPAAGRFQRDIADLERRIASMGLSEGPDAPAAAPAQPVAAAAPPPTPAPAAMPAAAAETAAAHGAVLILAGIGGPDAVRQILGALPAGFGRPVLISQRLDGGRYDRLVQQMGRAAALPVQLAEAGTRVEAGKVYIVPPELGLEAGEGLRFAAGTSLLQSLPAAESAVLLLSGADPAHVDEALAKATQGALVAGQSPEGCYDAAAPIALTSRGGSAAPPFELVQRLLQRWPA